MKITDEQIKSIYNRHCLVAPSSAYEIARELIALAQEVPLLSWCNRVGYHSALGLNSLYRVVPTDSKYSIVCITGDAAVSKVIASEIATIEEAETIANEHNRKRIVSQLKYGGGE